MCAYWLLGMLYRLELERVVSESFDSWLRENSIKP